MKFKVSLAEFQKALEKTSPAMPKKINFAHFGAFQF